MTWFKVDDGLHSHPKALAAGTAALGLWVRCGSYCAQHLTEGFIPTAVADMYGTRSMSSALVAAGLFVKVDGGFQMHDFLDRNPSREEVEKDRAAAAERQKRAREKARESRVKSHRESRRDDAVSHADVTPVVTVPPTRPDPTRTEESPSDSPVAALPDRFDEFWSAYPRRVDRGHAVKAWKAAVKKADPDVIIGGAVRFAEASRGTEPKFVAHPSTWLNGERWLDAPVTQLHAEGPRDPRQTRLRGVRL